ncbi:hemolysin transporter protein shlB, partial [Yersinia pestis PY-13]|jgi:ribosomal protein S18 acetylase RimI-like enzyme
MAFF